MTEVRTVAVPLVDGSALQLTVAEPDGSVRGGIVVLHEARGVTDVVRGLLHGLAEDGWLAVAPHLYHDVGTDRVGADDTDEWVRQQVDRLDGEQVLTDTDTAFGWLADHGVAPDRMGVVGVDLGGSVALLVAASRTLGAAVTVGGLVTEALPGGLPTPLDVAPGLTCPWLGIYGQSNPAIEQLREAVAASHVATDVVVYPGSGARLEADPAAAADAWRRTLNWLDAHLR